MIVVLSDFQTRHREKKSRLVNIDARADMKLSIVTISFNQGKFLEETIQSVLSQDYADFEYIVVDPGSTDGSRKIIEQYQDKIDKIIFEKDHGPADGLNKGFSVATGDILGFINSDDYFLPSAFTKIINYFQDHPDVDVVSGNAHIVDGAGNLLRYTYSDKFTKMGIAYGFSILVQPSTFFRATAYKGTNGFNPENHISWDGELFHDMKLAGAKFRRINAMLSAFRIYENNITGSGKNNPRNQAYTHRRFKKITGRNWKKIDYLVAYLVRLFRYITNPRDIYQRIVHGPIFARYSSTK